MRGHVQGPQRTHQMQRILLVIAFLIVIVALAVPALAGQHGRPLRRLLSATLTDLDEGRLSRAQRKRLRRVLREIRNENAVPTSQQPVASGPTTQQQFLIAARHCRSLVYEAPMREQCVAAVRHLDETHMVELIRACDRLGYEDRDELACLVGVARNPTPIASIRECDRAFYEDADELRCVAAMQRAPTSLVKTCERAFYEDAYELACIETIGHRRNTAGIVEYCDRAYYGDAETLECVRRFNGRRGLR